MYLLDKNKSVLSSAEIRKFKSQITKLKDRKISMHSNNIQAGIKAMKRDEFKVPTICN